MKVNLCKVIDIPDMSMKSFDITGQPVLVANVNGKFYAISDICSHAMAYLSEGELIPEDCQVQCPDHGAVFNLKTGDAVALPAVSPVSAYPITIEEDHLVIEMPD